MVFWVLQSAMLGNTRGHFHHCARQSCEYQTAFHDRYTLHGRVETGGTGVAIGSDLFVSLVFFFARVWELCVRRGTSHCDEFIWGARGMSLTSTTSSNKTTPKTKPSSHLSVGAVQSKTLARSCHTSERFCLPLVPPYLCLLHLAE